MTLMAQITISNASLGERLRLMLGTQHRKEKTLSSLPGIHSGGGEYAPRSGPYSFGVQVSQELQSGLALPAALTAMLAGPPVPTGVSATALWAKGRLGKLG